MLELALLETGKIFLNKEITMEDAVLKFELTISEANLILSTLGDLPAKTSMKVIQKMQQQAEPQVALLDPPMEIVEDDKDIS